MPTGVVVGHHDAPDPSDILPLVEVVAPSPDFEDESQRERFLEHVTGLCGMPIYLLTALLDEAIAEGPSTAAPFG